MNQPSLYQYIFNMLDYTDELVKRIEPGNFDNNDYFMTLVYVEKILDTYGRGLIRESARESGQDELAISELSKLANQRMEVLRRNIRSLSQSYDFDETLKSWGDSMYPDWHKLPADHPNIIALG